MRCVSTRFLREIHISTRPVVKQQLCGDLVTVHFIQSNSHSSLLCFWLKSHLWWRLVAFLYLSVVLKYGLIRCLRTHLYLLNQKQSRLLLNNLWGFGNGANATTKVKYYFLFSNLGLIQFSRVFFYQEGIFHSAFTHESPFHPLQASATPTDGSMASVYMAGLREYTHYQCFVNIFMGQRAVSSPSGAA